MPRRSIPVLDLTAGQGCARFERLRHTGQVVSPLLGGTSGCCLERDTKRESEVQPKDGVENYLRSDVHTEFVKRTTRYCHLGANGGVPGMASGVGMAGF
jgi:hypothetical protein